MFNLTDLTELYERLVTQETTIGPQNVPTLLNTVVMFLNTPVNMGF